jgi:hypothetical protein
MLRRRQDAKLLAAETNLQVMSEPLTCLQVKPAPFGVAGGRSHNMMANIGHLLDAPHND